MGVANQGGFIMPYADASGMVFRKALQNEAYLADINDYGKVSADSFGRGFYTGVDVIIW